MLIKLQNTDLSVSPTSNACNIPSKNMAGFIS